MLMLQSREEYVQIVDAKSLKQLIAISFVVLGALYSIPMFMTKGIPVCDDTTFHLGRLVGMSNVWTSPVNFNNFGQNGLMVNIFYPWLTMYPMWLLYKVSGSYVIAYKLYYGLLTITTLFIAYCSMHGILKSRPGAYLFAILYTFSAYRFADVYNRAALGEAIALTFLPIVLLGIYKIAFENHREWHKLTLGMSLIAYSHILSLLMSAVFIGVLFLVGLAIGGDRIKRLVAMIKAACLSMAVSAAMIVPMMEQYIRNNLYTPTGSGAVMANSADSIATLMRYSFESNPAGRGLGLTTAIALMMSVLLLIIGIATGKKKESQGFIFAACLLMIGLVIAVCATDMLPWRWIGDNTPIATIQFVWRLNAYTTLAFTATSAILVSDIMNSEKRNVIIAVLGAVVLLSGLQFYTMSAQNSQIISRDRIKEESIANWPSGNVDYTPKQAKEYKDSHGKTMEYIFVDDDKVGKTPVTESEGTLYRQDIGAADENRTVDIPVFRFYGESVSLNGEPVETSISERGTTLVEVPASKEAVIEISYKYTHLASAARILSIITLLLFVYFGAIKNEKSNNIRNI